jgi:hypothetical protein
MLDVGAAAGDLMERSGGETAARQMRVDAGNPEGERRRRGRGRRALQTRHLPAQILQYGIHGRQFSSGAAEENIE